MSGTIDHRLNDTVYLHVSILGIFQHEASEHFFMSAFECLESCFNSSKKDTSSKILPFQEQPKIAHRKERFTIANSLRSGYEAAQRTDSGRHLVSAYTQEFVQSLSLFSRGALVDLSVYCRPSSHIYPKRIRYHELRCGHVRTGHYGSKLCSQHGRTRL
jgi:hypothetical protein